MANTCELEKYMLVWLVINTVRSRMGLPLTKYEGTVPGKTQYAEIVRRLLAENNNNSGAEEL